MQNVNGVWLAHTAKSYAPIFSDTPWTKSYN